MRLADRLGVDRRTASETYYACLLSHAGCTTEAHVAAEVFGGSLTTSFNPLMYGSARESSRGCSVRCPIPGARRSFARFKPLAGFPGWLGKRVPPSARPARSRGCSPIESALPFRAGPPRPPHRALGRHGPLRRAKGEEIPLPMRIVHVATDAAFQRLLGGAEHAARLVRERAGHAFDPEVAACLVDDSFGDPRARGERLGVGRGPRPGAGPRAGVGGRALSIARLPRWGTSPT